MRYRTWAAAAAVTLVLGACANGAHPASQRGPKPLTLRTTPAGAAVELTDGTRCTTPCTLAMAGRSSSVETISLLGYKPVQTPIQVDASGAASPNPVVVTLVKEDPGGAAPLPVDGKTPASGH